MITHLVLQDQGRKYGEGFNLAVVVRERHAESASHQKQRNVGK